MNTPPSRFLIPSRCATTPRRSNSFSTVSLFLLSLREITSSQRALGQSSLNDLVDQVVEHFEGDFLTNEQVLVTVPTSKASVRCVVMERTPEERAQNVYRLARMKSGTIFNAEPKQIIRDRTLFSKTMIRRFIKESAARESYQNAPWVVKPSLASYYHIKKAMPADLLLHEERKHARMMQPTVVKSAGLTLTLKHSGGSYPDMGDERTFSYFYPR